MFLFPLLIYLRCLCRLVSPFVCYVRGSWLCCWWFGLAYSQLLLFTSLLLSTTRCPCSCSPIYIIFLTCGWTAIMILWSMSEFSLWFPRTHCRSRFECLHESISLLCGIDILVCQTGFHLYSLGVVTFSTYVYLIVVHYGCIIYPRAHNICARSLCCVVSISTITRMRLLFIV